MKYSLGVIGFGVMGQAIVKRALEKQVLSAEEVLVYDVDVEKIKNSGAAVSIAVSANELVKNSDRVFLAVKPQQYTEIVKNLDFSTVKTIITIMAGVSTNILRQKTDFDGGIVRVMPNTPCALGKGVCAYYCDNVPLEEKSFVESVLSSCGDIVPITQDQFDAVTGVSGSGPAYVYLIAQGMIQGGVEGGLSYEQSKTLALNTLIGAAELAKTAKEDLDTLIDRVCSKGGTTIEAVKVYRENGLTDLIAKGIGACRKRSSELGKD